MYIITNELGVRLHALDVGVGNLRKIRRPPRRGDRNRSRFMLYPANVTTCERLFNGLVVENTNRVRLDRANDPSNVIYELQEINVITKLLQPGWKKESGFFFS